MLPSSFEVARHLTTDAVVRVIVESVAFRASRSLLARCESRLTRYRLEALSKHDVGT